MRVDRRLLYHFDWVLLLLLVLVAGMAMLNLYSATWSEQLDGPSAIFYRQAMFYLAGTVAMAAILLVDYGELALLGYAFYGAVLLMLVYTDFFGRTTIAGTQRWIDLGVIHVQPSEFAKLALVLVLADAFARTDKPDGLALRDLGRPIALTGVPFLLILIQPDLGTALMLVILAGSMTLFVRLRWSATAILGALGLGAAAVGWKFVLKDYQRRRIETFLNPEADPMNHGYQITQSKIAVGSGGTLGKGFLEGTQGHLHFLPERHTDFAFSVWAEEWGFVGSLFFLGCYFLMLLWGINTAMVARDRYGVLLAFGVVMLIFWQAVINLLMIMGFLPVVGIPLPLFSYGGSSLLTSLMALAVLMNVRMRRFEER